MITKNIVFALVVIFLTGCAGNREKAEHFEALPFPEVVPPAMMENQFDRASYVSLHMWDEVTDSEKGYPCDSLLVNGYRLSDVEQEFANWIYVLDILDFESVQKSVSRLFDRSVSCEKKDTSSNVFETFTDLMVKYLYDANSPLRNEDYYAVYAEKLASCDLVEDLMKEKYAREVKMASLNRIGTKAMDFSFTDKRGKVHSLYGIESDLILLFFSNPGCTACMNIINVLNDDPAISSLISDGIMAVLNIYIDEDITEWFSYMPVYSDAWYNGFDHNMVIRGDKLYNIRAIPSLYLLDRDKTVIMKDAPEAKLFDYLSSLVEQAF